MASPTAVTIPLQGFLKLSTSLTSLDANCPWRCPMTLCQSIVVPAIIAGHQGGGDIALQRAHSIDHATKSPKRVHSHEGFLPDSGIPFGNSRASTSSWGIAASVVQLR